MTVVRVRGFQIFEDRLGKTRCYHRKSRIAIDLEKYALGSVEFFAECGRIADLMSAKPKPKAGTLGQLIEDYRSSEQFSDLAPRTKKDYQGKLDYLQPLHTMSLAAIDSPFVINVRDKASKKHGRRFGNYVKSVLSIVLAFGKERGRVQINAAASVKDIRRKKGAPHANRPWTDAERFAVLEASPDHIKVPIALGMYAGLREGDALSLPKTAIRDGMITLVTAKAGVTVALPIMSYLADILANSKPHKAATVAANSRGQKWTESGFRASWRKVRIGLEKDEKVGPGLTFHGLRHTVATTLRENDIDPRLIADALGQKTEGMALHYSKTADLTKSMAGVGRIMEAAEQKARQKFGKPDAKILSNSEENDSVKLRENEEIEC